MDGSGSPLPGGIPDAFLPGIPASTAAGRVATAMLRTVLIAQPPGQDGRAQASGASTKARPAGVMRKRWFRLVGLSGIVISIQPSS